MKVIIPIAFLFLFIQTACHLRDNKAAVSSRDTISVDSIINSSDWEFDKVDDRSLTFTNGRSINTHLYDLRYIGQIKIRNKAPFLIFSGRYCDNCDDPFSIYVHSPIEGDLVVALGKNGYAYPAEEKDSTTDDLLYQTRVFYGQVLEKSKGVIWYQKKLTPTRKWETDIYFIDLSSDERKEGTLKDNGQLTHTLELLKDGKCMEIKGITD